MTCPLRVLRHVVFAVVALSTVCLAAPSGKDLGLHSDGGPWQFYPEKGRTGKIPRVLLIGDSIMNGYRGRVMAALKGKADVDCWLTPLHLASKDLHHDLRKVLSQGPYDVIHFNIGLHGWTPGRIPDGQYEPLLRQYVAILRAHSPQVRLVWASTTQITVKGKPTQLDPVHNKTIAARNAIAARVMKDYGIAVDDLYALMSDKLTLARGDGFHWHARGYELMAKQIVRHLHQALSKPATRPRPGGATTRPARDVPSTDAVPDGLVWESPGKGPRDSMPIGNGDLGANVWVEQNGDLVFYLAKTDAWSENGRLLKLGRVRVRLDPPLYAPGATFEQRLDLAKGHIRLHATHGKRHATVVFWIDANAPVIRLDAESNAEFSLGASLELWRTKRRRLQGQEAHSAYGLHGAGGPAISVEPDTIVPNLTDRLIWYHRNERSIWADNLKLQALGNLADKAKDPLLHRTFGCLMRGDGLASVSATRLASARPGKAFSLEIYPLTKQTPTAAAWLDGIRQRATAHARHAEAKDRHERWWEAFWNRSWIRLRGDAGAERVTQAYALQRWVNACSGRGKSPIKFNGSIFTVDANDKGSWDADYRRWGGPYWWQNTRLAYWNMLSAGDYDLMQPLYHMFLEALPLRKAATRTYYGHGGAFYPETQYFWGTYTDANYGRSRAKLPNGMTENRYIRYYWQGGLELSLMMLDTRAHTQDASFARTTLVPLVSEVMTFFDQHWKRDAAGKIRFDPAMALETYNTAVNPLVEIVAIRKVAQGLLALPETLTSAEQRRQWRRMIGELPPVPTRTIKGQTYLAPAERFSGKQNSENPELYAVFPYRRYGVGKPDLDLARRTFAARTHKGTGGWQQSAIQAALLGLADDAKEMVVANASRKAGGFRFPAMWGPNFDWIPDQDHGCVMMIALQRMVLQCDAEEIRVLPAWPKDWDVDFRLHAPSQTVIEGVAKDGKLERLSVTPATRRKDVVMGPGVPDPRL